MLLEVNGPIDAAVLEKAIELLLVSNLLFIIIGAHQVEDVSQQHHMKVIREKYLV